MMSVPESILEEMEFTWKIENFSLHRQECGEAIHSPLLSAGSPRHSIWCLKLYPRGTAPSCEHIVTSELVRLEGSLKGHLVCKVSLVASDGNTLEGQISTNCRSFLWNQNSLVNYGKKMLVPEDFMEVFLPNDTLTLQCRLMLKGVPPNYAEELTELSQSFGCLYESGDYSDLVLCAGDREFPVHKAVLSRRAPKLFRDLGLSDDLKVERVEVGDISAPVLHILLMYLYSGKLPTLPPKSVQELFEVAEKYGISTQNFVELTSDVIALISPATIHTHIKGVRRTIDWIVVNANQVMGEGKQVFSNISFGSMRFLVRFSIQADRRMDLINISFRCLSNLEEDVHLGCRMSMGSHKRNMTRWLTHRMCFSANNLEQLLPKHPCHHLLDLRRGCSLRLKLVLSVSDGKEDHSVEGMTIVSPEIPSLFGMNLLRYDLISLFDDTQTGNSGDVTLVFKDKTISVNRAVLAARSPVFSGMFAHDMTERNSDRVNILDIDHGTALRLVRFMYSGNVFKQSFSEDAKLYIAADKYQVTSLFRKCSSFLISDLILSNACDILTMAYMHNDECLMTTVKDYVRCNPEAILGTSEWKLLCDTNPRLAVLVKESIRLL